jgi:type I restriction enzyme, S subunit
MTSEWNHSTINDVCVLVTDGSHSSPKSVNDGKYMVSVKDFTDYGFDFASCRMISNDDYETLKRNGCVPQMDDILIGKDGARFFEDIIIYRQREKPALLSSIAILRCDKSKILPDFLYYVLRTPSFRQDVKDNYGSGSAIPRIILKDFKRMMVSYPSLEKQQSIISVLTAIDSKIQANTEINDNLEQQAQAIYHERFETVSPNDLPYDWRIVTLGEVVTISNKSFNPLKEPEILLEHYSIPAFDEARFPVFELSTSIKSNKFIIDASCFMISKLNPTTKRVWKPYCLTEDAVCSTEFIVYKAKDQAITDFLYSVIDSGSFSDFMCSHVTGSTGSRQRTTPAETLSYKLILPSENELAEFQSLVSPMYAQMRINAIENDKLKRLRDSLLPKLMSGEIDVSAVQL